MAEQPPQPTHYDSDTESDDENAPQPPKFMEMSYYCKRASQNLYRNYLSQFDDRTKEEDCYYGSYYPQMKVFKCGLYRLHLPGYLPPSELQLRSHVQPCLTMKLHNKFFASKDFSIEGDQKATLYYNCNINLSEDVNAWFDLDVKFHTLDFMINGFIRVVPNFMVLHNISNTPVYFKQGEYVGEVQFFNLCKKNVHELILSREYKRYTSCHFCPT